jgi:hypothetical protein
LFPSLAAPLSCHNSLTSVLGCSFCSVSMEMERMDRRTDLVVVFRYLVFVRQSGFFLTAFWFFSSAFRHFLRFFPLFDSNPFILSQMCVYMADPCVFVPLLVLLI